MNYGRAIVICKNLNSEEHSESEFIEAVGTILDMPTINAVPKEALLNVVRYFWENCVVLLQAGEDEDVISRAAAVKAIMGEHPDAHYPDWYAAIIKGLPASDVRPLVRGKWIYDCERVAADGWTYRQHHCSVCGRKTIEADNYCPSCGADMREDKQE